MLVNTCLESWNCVYHAFCIYLQHITNRCTIYLILNCIQKKLVHVLMHLIRLLDPSRWRHCVAWNVANWLPILTFIGLCIVIYFYSKTNQMHHCLKFILFCSNTTCLGRFFRTSSGVQDYIQQQAYVKQMFDIRLLLFVQSWTSDDGRKDHPKHYVNQILLSAC